MKTAIICSLLAAIAVPVCAVPATVSDVVAHQRKDGSGKVDITYKLYDSDSPSVYVTIEISTDGGSTYRSRSHVSGHVGRVSTGGSRSVVWDAKGSLGSSAVFPSCSAIITADDHCKVGVTPGGTSGGVYSGQVIYIPAGSFLMGNSDVGDDKWSPEHKPGPEELKQHSVYLAGYHIGKHEVTRGEYRQFMTAGGYSNPRWWSAEGWNWRVLTPAQTLGQSNTRTEPLYWAATQEMGSGGSFTQTDNHPVVGVSYYEAEAFCKWAGGQLPTEAQWERAARWTGSHPNVCPWGDTWNKDCCNNVDDTNLAGGGYQRCQTAPVGSYSSGASPSGCQDMAGNVQEWCQDWYRSYSGNPSPFDYTGRSRVVRGGCWGSSRFDLRCASRRDLHPSRNHDALGFRLAR